LVLDGKEFDLWKHDVSCVLTSVLLSQSNLTAISERRLKENVGRGQWIHFYTTATQDKIIQM